MTEEVGQTRPTPGSKDSQATSTWTHARIASFCPSVQTDPGNVVLMVGGLPPQPMVTGHSGGGRDKQNTPARITSVQKQSGPGCRFSTQRWRVRFIYTQSAFKPLSIHLRHGGHAGHPISFIYLICRVHPCQDCSFLKVCFTKKKRMSSFMHRHVS